MKFYYFSFKNGTVPSEGVLMANSKKHCRGMIKSSFPKARLIVIKSEKNCLASESSSIKESKLKARLQEVVDENTKVDSVSPDLSSGTLED